MEPPGSHGGRVTESRVGGRFWAFRPPRPSSEGAPLALGWPSLGLCVAGREVMRLEWELITELSERSEGLLQWLNGKESACNSGSTGEVGSSPVLGGAPEGEMATHSGILVWKIPWAEEPPGCSPWGRKESNTTEHTCTHENSAPQEPAPQPSILARHTPRTGHQDSWHGPKNKQGLGQQPLPPDNRPAVHSPP